MRLYFKKGACSKATHIILHELDLAYSLDQVHSGTDRTTSGKDYNSINPNGYVPALELSTGEVLTEGTAILQYLADQHLHSGLAPAPGTLERAQLQSLLSYISSELHKAFKPFFSGAQLSDDERTTAVKVVGSGLSYVESLLEVGHDFLLGDRFTIADAYGFVVLTWASAVGIDTAGWPRLEAFLLRIGARDSVLRASAAEEAAA